MTERPLNSDETIICGRCGVCKATVAFRDPSFFGDSRYFRCPQCARWMRKQFAVEKTEAPRSSVDEERPPTR